MRFRQNYLSLSNINENLPSVFQCFSQDYDDVFSEAPKGLSPLRGIEHFHWPHMKDNFQLKYLSDERRFHTINIGKDEITLHEPEGKRGKEILSTESRANLKIIDKTFVDLVLKRSLHFVLNNCYSSIVVDKIIMKGSMSCYSLDLSCVKFSNWLI